MNLIIDAHQDIAYNLLSFGRDYTRSVYQPRQDELNRTIPGLTSQSLLGWPQYNLGKVAVVLATLFASPARLEKDHYPNQQSSRSPDEASPDNWKQLRLYHRLVEETPRSFRLIGTKSDLEHHLREWAQQPADPEPEEYLPIRLIQTMEAAEGITDFDELPLWWHS